MRYGVGDPCHWALVTSKMWPRFVYLDYHPRASGIANGLRSELIRD